MTSTIRSITMDCRNPELLARFWEAVLGYEFKGADEEDGYIVDPTDQKPRLLFIAVLEDKTIKNRVHLDLRPEDTMEKEVERLLALGARRAQAFLDQTRWTVLEDPEGNEFCVERGPGD